MIRFQNISKVYSGKTVALDDVSFEVREKEFVSVVGKSGCGKTTLFKLLLAEERPSSGRVFLDGLEIQKIRPKQLPFLRRRIGAIFQDYRLLHSKNVFENVAYAMEVVGASDSEIKRDVADVLAIVGLSDKAYNFPVELSGGEKQRVAIARALIHRPEVIMADEPTGNLDPYHTLEIIRLLLKINESGTTVVLATHNKDVVNSLNKRVITLQEGRVVRDEESGRFNI